MHTYSTSEHLVGTWIDSKPVYEITFNGSWSISTSSMAWTTFSGASISNCDKLISVIASGDKTVFSGAMPLWKVDNSSLQGYNVSGLGTMTIKNITVRYTKTTN